MRTYTYKVIKPESQQSDSMVYFHAANRTDADITAKYLAGRGANAEFISSMPEGYLYELSQPWGEEDD